MSTEVAVQLGDAIERIEVAAEVTEAALLAELPELREAAAVG